MRDIKEDVPGRWTSIFNRLGIQVGDGTHTECPLCGKPGKHKPFRYDDIDGAGTWICSNCGAGDGWLLLMKKLQLSFPQAVKTVENIIGVCPVTKAAQEVKASPEALRKVFAESFPMRYGDLGAWYLQSRGLKTFPATLRTTKRCWESTTRTYCNAMLGMFHSHGGQMLTIHRTFLDEHGAKLGIEDPKRVMPSLGKMVGGAVRIFPEGENLGIAEGIESAIAAYELFGIPVWSALCATLLESFIPPPSVKRLYIFADNDANYHGQKSAFTLANRLMIKGGLEVYVRYPDTTGCDWLDILQKVNKK